MQIRALLFRRDHEGAAQCDPDGDSGVAPRPGRAIRQWPDGAPGGLIAWDCGKNEGPAQVVSGGTIRMRPRGGAASIPDELSPATPYGAYGGGASRKRPRRPRPSSAFSRTRRPAPLQGSPALRGFRKITRTFAADFATFLCVPHNRPFSDLPPRRLRSCRRVFQLIRADLRL